MSPTLRRTLPWVALLLVLLLAGFVPFQGLIDHVPWGPDAAKWVDRGTVDSPGWTRWVFSSKHFIGYRPMTALTFVINEWLTGYEPWGYRVTDLLLHVLVGGVLFDVHRRLTGDRGAWGLIAVLVLLVHPATEEVLPYVARRSYLLQALLSLCSVSLTLRALSAASRGWRAVHWLGVAATTALALLSNEGAFVVFVWLPLLVVAHSPGALRERLRPVLGLLPTAFVAVAVLARRVVVLGSLTGGYGKHYFAFTRGGRIMWKDMAQPDHALIADACLRYTLAPHGVTGSWVPGLRALAPLTALSVVVGLLLTVRSDDAERRWNGPLLLVWMLGASAIVVASGTWFWRQAYFLLPPLGLGLAVLARQTHGHLRARRWSGLVALPALVLVPIAVLAAGPLLHGMNEEAHGPRILYGAHVHDIRQRTADLQGPGTVYLAIRGRAGSVHNVRIWSNRFGAERGLAFKVLARRDNESRPGTGRLEMHDREGRPQLAIDGKHIKWETSRIDGVRLRGIKRLWLDRLWLATQSRWVYAATDDGVRLEKVPPPPASKPARPRDR